MYVVRPATLEDADELFDLLALTGGAITTLSGDREQLQKRLQRSLQAFDFPPDKPAGETYVFVMQHDDGGTSRIVGTSSVQSKTGGFEPFYGYKIEDEHYVSTALGVDKVVQSLHLAEDHSGPAEVGGLFLHPDHRGGGRGRLLSLSRFLFMAMRPTAFDAHVVAELRGVIDSNGQSPFWNAVGRHFFEVPFAVADRLSFAERRIIADLMPDHPIYIEMLPQAARDVIGVEHPESSAARHVLEAEGFAFCSRVDIFDAGPTLETALQEIRVVRDCRPAEVKVASGGGSELMAGTGSDRPVFFLASETDQGVAVPQDLAAATGLRDGAKALVVPLKLT